jgi:hypothetical protein
MTEAVRAVMTEQAKARPSERDTQNWWIAEQLHQARRSRTDAAKALAPARARRDGSASAARPKRRPRHLGCGDGRPSAPGPGEILVRVQACDLSHVAPAPGADAASQLFVDGTRICGLDAAATVIATGDSVTRFAVGDEVFGHFPTKSWNWSEGPCGRTTDGPHVELRPDALDPRAAAALAHHGLTAKTILRAAKVKPGHTALVIGAASTTGKILLSLLAETGVDVIDSATVEGTSGDPLFEALTAYPDLDLLVDLFAFGEPYFITGGARHGTIVSAVPRPDGPGISRIGITAQSGDLAALALLEFDERQALEIAL